RLAYPRKHIHVADLVAASAGASPDPRSGPAAELVAQGIRVSRDGSGDAVLDRRARADYRERLADLHRELDDAERCNDEGRVARARAELDFIAGELASAFGLGGRGRRAGSPIERARKAVASRIRFSLTHGRGPRKGGFLMSARLIAIAIAVLVTAAPSMAQTPERPIGDIEVFATLPYPGHPGGLAVAGRTLYLDTSNADFDRPFDASD